VKARTVAAGKELDPILQTYLETMNLDLPLDDLLTYEKVFKK
jgi:hypothetical protein